MLHCFRLLLILSSISVFAAEDPAAVELGDSKKQLSQSDVAYFYDPTHNLSISDVTGKDHPEWRRKGSPDRWEYVDFQYSDDALWMRARLVNRSQSITSWVWQIDYVYLNHIEFYQVDPNTGQVIQLTDPPLGDHHVREHWSERSRTPYFNFSLPPGEETLIYIRAVSNSHLWMDSIIWPARKFTTYSTHDFGFLSLFFGFMMAMFAYNCVLYLITREKGYLYYVLYVAAQFLWQATSFGFLGFFYIVPDPWLLDRMPFITPSVCSIMGCLFIIHILDLKHNSRKSYYFIIGVAVTFLIYLASVPFSSYGFSMTTVRVLAVAGCLIMLLVGIQQWRQGNPEGKYFTLAWSPLLISSVIYSMALMAIVEWSKWMEYVHIVGTNLEMFLLAMVLGSRINRERREREKAQNEAFEKEKEAIEARAESKAKTEFFAKMSHEIRTPMNGVLGIVELLKLSELDEKQRDMVNTIHSSGKSLLTIINDLLDLSKFESGKLELESIPVNTEALIDETISVMGSRLKDGPVVLKKHESIAAIPDVMGDPTRICQILMNLTSNALKFTQQGSVTLNQQIETRQQDSLSIRFEVIDTGIGISSEQQQKLFTPFVQADSSTTREFGGTGLGLSICKDLVELMGGEIGIQSAPGEGTTFWFVIPFRIAERPGYSEKPEKFHKSRSLDGLRALVADDNPVNRSVMSGMLSRLGVSSRCCNDGMEALEALQEESFDIVFLDCEMPVMDGYTTSKKIKDVESLEATPVIAVTAHSSDEISGKCKAHGMDDLITKPVTMDKIRDVILDNI